MSQVQTIPIVDAILERGRYSWVWIVLECPFCGKQHEHYAGSSAHDVYRYLGQLVIAKCDKTDRRRIAPGAPDIKLEYVLEAAQLPPFSAHSHVTEGMTNC